jgi:hypothetical protein
MSAPPCVDCLHYRGEACYRREYRCPVRGVQRNPVSAFDERKPNWIDRMVERDRCGLEGKYFEPNEHAAKRLAVAKTASATVVHRLAAGYHQRRLDDE